jgi:hypothetical protein
MNPRIPAKNKIKVWCFAGGPAPRFTYWVSPEYAEVKHDSSSKTLQVKVRTLTRGVPYSADDTHTQTYVSLKVRTFGLGLRSADAPAAADEPDDD